MPVKKLRFALFGNVYQAEKSVSTARVMQYLASQGIEMCVERGFLEFLRQRGHVPPAGVPGSSPGSAASSAEWDIVPGMFSLTFSRIRETLS